MPKTLTEITQEAVKLPPPERLQLARILIDLSEPDAEPDAEVERAWDKEIERRLEELRSGKVKGVPLDEVKRKMEKRFRS
jgi:putative addiction module component (TIGR02574 family)